MARTASRLAGAGRGRGHLALLLAGLVLAACDTASTQPPPPPPGIDLVALFPWARLWTEAREIDFGAPEARPHLWGGWAYDERLGRDSVVWALGEESSVRLFIGVPRDLELVLDAWGLDTRELPPQQVTIAVNGREVGRLELGRGPGAALRTPVAADAWSAGENLITFRYGHAARPFELFAASGDVRPLAAAWDRLRIEGLRDAGWPEVRPASSSRPPSLVLPYGSQVDYFLDLPTPRRLILEDVDFSGDGGRLEIRFGADGGDAERVVKVTAAGPQSIDLPASPTPVKLAFRALHPASGKGGLRLSQPHLRELAPATAAPPERTREAGAAAVLRPAKDPAVVPANVIVYLIDTLRADHLGCYGYSRPTSPEIDALAEDGILFEQAIAQSSWTRPTVTSLLTGLYPPSHGATGDRDTLPETVTTLPEILSRAGWDTAAVVTNGVVSQQFGYDRGYGSFHYLPECHDCDEIHQLSDRVGEVARQWIAGRDSRAPFFLYLHTTDPHAPYQPRSPFAERFAGDVEDPEIGLHHRVEGLVRQREPIREAQRRDLLALYDAEIAFNDAQLGALLDWLRGQGLYDDTLVVLVSDHGEEFFEHGRWQHGFTLHREQLRIPWILKLPGNEAAGRRIGQLVEQVDLVPTLLDVLGLEIPAEIQGRSLLPEIRSPRSASPARPAFAHLARAPGFRELDAVLLDGHKLIRYRHYDRPHGAIELYDRQADLRETVDLAGRKPILAGYLEMRLQARIASWHRRTAEPAEIGPELERRLRALGYLD